MSSLVLSLEISLVWSTELSLSELSSGRVFGTLFYLVAKILSVYLVSLRDTEN